MKEKTYKIYKAYVSQTFDTYWNEGKIFRKRKVVGTDTVKEYERYIMARSKEEAIEFYKERYEWEFDYCINHFWHWRSDGVHMSILPNFKNEVNAYEVHPTFNTLKEKLRGDDFLMYCRQEMYPIEVLLKS